MKYIKGKRVLITGISGFIGRRLAESMRDLGAVVYGISQKEESRYSLKGNILHYEFVHDVIRKKKIHVCIHLAGDLYPLVPSR